MDEESQDVRVYQGGGPRVRVSLANETLTVEIDGKRAFSKRDDRWADGAMPACGDDPDDWSPACDCSFVAGLWGASWSAERRLLWLRVDSDGFHHCDTPEHYVALTLR